jgi:uncharacterized pyridoxamine 5'-phosphate oxidase family protein
MNKDDVLDIVSDAGFAMLATMDGDQPRVRPLAPYYSEDGELLVGLLPNCRTISQVKANPKVELCFVDRKMAFCRITGSASIVEDEGKKTELWDNVPNLKMYFSGPQDPNYNLMVIKIEEVEASTPQRMEPEKIDF